MKRRVWSSNVYLLETDKVYIDTLIATDWELA